MEKFRKIVSGLLSVTSALALTGIGMVTTAYGAQLTSASSLLSNSLQSGTSTHTISFNLATTGNVRQIRLQYATTASGAATLPTNLGLATTVTNGVLAAGVVSGADTEANWTILNGGGGGDSNASSGLLVIQRGSSALSATSGDTFTLRVPSVTNNDLTSGCDAVTDSDSCFIRISVYSDTGSTLVDQATITYTVNNDVTVTATVDPILIFTIAGVTSGNLGSNDSNAGAGTNVTTTTTTLPFGNVTVGTAKKAQQSITVQTNANNGYAVRGKFTGADVMIGSASASNNIDKFTTGGSTWSSPAAFIAPTGTTASVNSAWLGLRTTDTDVANFNVSNVYGPPDVAGDSGTGQIVMSSTTPDNGTTAQYVTFKIQANAFQPADSYTGTWRWSVIPTY